ncbi:MAG: phosphodiester glycosidase family protein [Clostridia bacterium]|nr:phosphodiester glycosidase family protein [Clostridia bacterium]
MNPKKAFDYENEDDNDNDNTESADDGDSVIEVTRTSTAPKRTARRSPATDETERQPQRADTQGARTQNAGAQSARTQSPAPNRVRTANRPAPNANVRGAGGTRRKKRRRVPRPLGYFGRVMLVIFTVIFIVIFALFAVLKTVATGPSETLRDMLVLSAMQASATKWVPYLFLDSETVDEILASAEVTQTDVISMDSYTRYTVDTSESTGVSYPDDTGSEQSGDETGDSSGGTASVSSEWDSAIDGMLYTTVSSSTYKAYILIIKDPSRVYVGTSSDFGSGQKGVRIFDIVAKEGAVAAINGGEFEDTGGQGTGDNPMGLTYSKGSCVWNDGLYRTFIGFDSDNNLVVANSMSKATADSLGIRDGVSFQTGNVLISNDGENVTVYYADANTGTSQRTAIGQRADGAVIMIVTDGRTASSIGATRNDIIDLLVSLGAVTAGMLDGGSSAMMYYEDYFTKYGIDTSYLDSYQLQGLCNVYKAFTTPRRLPTFFLVSPEG